MKISTQDNAFIKAKPRRLAARLRMQRRALRSAYSKALKSQGTMQEWLRDNYYLLEREGSMAEKELKKMPALPSKDGYPIMYTLCAEAIIQQGPLEEAIDRCLEDTGRWFESRELESIGLFVSVALFDVAYRALQEPSGEMLLAEAVSRLRELPGVDYEGFIRRFCETESIFSQDPAGIYLQMDERSRALYRRECARQADRRKESEAQYAVRLLEQAQQAKIPRERHIGYALLEQAKQRHRRKVRGRIFLWVRLLLPLIVAIAIACLVGAPWLFLVLYLPCFEILRPLVELFSLKGVEPILLPRMEMDGIPQDAPTLVAVSCLLPSPDRAGQLAAHLEDLWRCNHRGNIKFALLCDLKQSEQPVQPEDEPAMQALTREIIRLNRKHGDHFIMLVRPRVLIRTQDAFAGYERKRGAIAELCHFARSGKGRFLKMEGNRNFLHTIRYLIALDSDTNLLMDTAEQLVSIARHPLNRPVIDQEKGIVTQGYGMIAPRMETDIASAGKTLFSRIMTGAGGVTAYDTLSGNFYQDLFGEGIFAGKGLIDVEAFNRCLYDALPEERVLSHDILEGGFLRTAFASDVELTDGCPSTAQSWVSRMHRWIRGDFQNILWLFRQVPDRQSKRKNPLPPLQRFFLFDNLMRALAPVGALALLVLSLFWQEMACLFIPLVFFSAAAAGIFSAIHALLAGGISMLSRRYYSRVMPDALGALARAVVLSVLLIHTALLTLDAAVRALWRQLVSRRNLLEWTTAADAEKKVQNGLLSAVMQCKVSFLGGLCMIIFFGGCIRLAGFMLVACPFVMYLTQRPLTKRSPGLSDTQREELRSYAASMWRYYAERCTASDHFLPPDNLQESPVHAVAHRTSPTNIGLMLLSTLCARDFGFIDTNLLSERIGKAIESIEKCEKWHGNLLNWYDTRTLRALTPRFCSAVDSGNFVCCLVALREGLLEYKSESADLIPLIERIDRLLNQTDLSPMYDARRKLFHIGYDLEAGKLSPSYYDLLMSESRMTSYYAVATRQVPKKHWGALGRTLAREGSYTGPVSWTGTMFEYFMPHLLLPVRENSMIYEALQFCLYCQRRRAAAKNAPWGCSESGFYAFDPQFNYQYKAHGIQRLGLKRQLNDEFVISPYSSFLALPWAPRTAMRNLDRLKHMGMTGDYGFYEAADFTKKRRGNARFAIVRSYMAHHVGMSLCAVTNALFDNILQRRFMRGEMSTARELLEEKIPSGAPVFDDVVERDIPDKPGRGNSQLDEFDKINPRLPRMHVLSNGDWTLAISDTGASVSVCQGVDVTRRSRDLLRRPQGIFAFVSGGGVSFSLTRAPDYADRAAHRVEFAPGYAAFYARRGILEGGMSACVHPHMQCEQRTLMLKNHSNKKIDVSVTLYFEPCLTRAEDAAAHPAYSALFLESDYEESLNLCTFSRRTKRDETPIHLAVGFLDGRPFELERSREKILRRPLGIASLQRMIGMEFTPGDGLPDVCAALRVTLELPARSQRSVTLLLSAAVTRDQAVARLISCRSQGELSPSHGAQSPLFDGGLESRLASMVLPELYYSTRDHKRRLEAARQNSSGLPTLWSAGISGDLPIVVCEVTGEADSHTVQAYLALHGRLRRCAVKFDLVLLYEEGGDYHHPILEMMKRQVTAAGAEELLSRKGGIHLVDLSIQNKEVKNVLLACACFVAPKSMTAVAPMLPEYTPLHLSTCQGPDTPVPAGYDVEGGVFSGENFIVTKTPRMPWCHIIAKEGFGTLVSDSALGFTFARNARENKLTPWYNDSRSDNNGEMLFLRVDGKVYDALNGSRACFSPGQAVYEGRAGAVSFRLTVYVAHELSCKVLELEIKGEGAVEAAYYTEPVLGVDRKYAHMITGSWENGCLVLKNPFQTEFPGSMVLCSNHADTRCCGDRAAFLSGRWDEHTLPPLADPCAALVVKCTHAQQGEKIRFILSFHEEKEEAMKQARLAADGCAPLLCETHNQIRIETPDEGLNHLFNTWLPQQICGARIHARTGFYQCSGAWGFRDQLQDSCAQLLMEPSAARAHILRCCTRQFEQGDVLHWWHELRNGPAGVRTRCSDDMVWLPYTVCEYIEKTGDTALLEEEVPYLSAPELEEGEEERYFTPAVSQHQGSVFEHCIRALERVRYGEHGLPLIGTCDWNDGFSAVGPEGRGESVWLAQFVCLVSERMAALCLRKGEADQARRLLDEAQRLRLAVDEKAWDGQWYLRAFFDSGLPLGSQHSREGVIDLLPQAFSVFARLPDRERRRMALDACLERLVDREYGVIRLFTPAFDKVIAGYISAYPAGLRENGGQYTHAAVWLALALLQEGRADEGYELLCMMNPAVRCRNAQWAKRYQTEPYALAADVYDHPGAQGRGGWTQYTGAAGWFYRTVLSGLLGIHIADGAISLHPCLPSTWEGFRVHMRWMDTELSIVVKRAEQEELLLDSQPAREIPLDKMHHEVELTVAKSAPL